MREMSRILSGRVLIAAALFLFVHAGSAQTVERPAQPLVLAKANSKDAEAGSGPLVPETLRVGHATLSLDGIWSVTPMPLKVEGEAGYRLFSQTNGEQFAAQV